MNFYDSIIEGAQELPANERGQLYAAVLEYLYYGRDPDFAMKAAPKAIFMSMRPVFDNQRAKQEAGRKGGKAQAKAKQTASKAEAEREAEAKQGGSRAQTEGQADAKQNASEQEQEQEVEKTTAKAVAKKRARFVPPTPEEVDAYIAEKGYSGFDGEGFCAFYASKGWKVGNQPMRDWKRACVTWQKRREAERPTAQAKEADGFDDFAI